MNTFKRLIGFFFCAFICCGFMAVRAGAENDLAIDETNFPDPAFRSYLSQQFDLNKDGVLESWETNRVGEIYVWNMGISTLEGIELFPNLHALECLSNSIQTLDVSRNPKLDHLACSYNPLTELDLSCNPRMIYLICNGAPSLTDLNVSGCSELVTLECY